MEDREGHLLGCVVAQLSQTWAFGRGGSADNSGDSSGVASHANTYTFFALRGDGVDGNV